MRTTSLFPSVLAIICFAGLTGCGGSAPEEDVGGQESVGTQEEAATASVGTCLDGMTTKVKKINQFATRCSLAQLPEMVNNICAHEPEVCNFLWGTLDGHGLIQCTKDPVTSQYCADVIDRNPDGSSLEDPKFPQDAYKKNYFVAYVVDTFYPQHPEVGYWNGALGNALLTNDPVALSFAGRVDKKLTFHKAFGAQPSLDSRSRRLFKFDPRGCGGCGFYNGPNQGYVFDPAEFATGWWPGFDSGICTYQQKSAQGYAEWYPLTPMECDHEYFYRETSR